MNALSSAAGDLPPHARRYAATVEAFIPCIAADELRKRCGVLYLRDRASRARPIARHEAALVLTSIESLATLHAFRAMPVEQLDTLHRSLGLLMSIATALEHHGPHDRQLNG